MNMEPYIIFEDSSELADFEAENRGYRGDIIVKIGTRRYRLYAITLLRLQQDFETEIKDSGFYQSEPNMILVKETTKKKIVDTIVKLWECQYFERLENMGFAEE